MTPSPLSPNILHILLQYISPPSQLTQPIPSHLLSKPLLQRHHFLGFTPEQPDEYICWPSSSDRNAHVIDLLETRSRPLNDEPTAYPIQYSFDGEDFFAHVDLTENSVPGPRVILQWDDSGDWRYHNTDLMPFPPGSRACLEDVLVPPLPPKPVSILALSGSAYSQTYGVEDLQDDSDDDDYWNAYGSTDIGDSHFGHSTPGSVKDGISTEDAYWAQYASVQGTADSTIPSPVPPRRPLASFQQNQTQKTTASPKPLPVPVRVSSEETYAEPLPIPQGIMPRPRSNSRWDPADATTLAHLLSTLSPRETLVPSPAPDGQSDVAEEILSSPTIGGSNDSDMASPPALGLHDASTASLNASESLGSDLVRAIDGRVDEDEADLRAALLGVWRMWRKTRSIVGGPDVPFGDSGAREIFLRNARFVVDGAA